jgi:glycosyltransferase involved in cell wall biosynthesis
MFLDSATQPNGPRDRRARRERFVGLFADETDPGSHWIRESATLLFPASRDRGELVVEGVVLDPAPGDRTAGGTLGLEASLDGQPPVGGPLATGDFSLRLPLPAQAPPGGHRLTLTLRGVASGNLLAWLGRVTALPVLQAWRRQTRNRRLRIRRVTLDGEVLFDFANRASPWNRAFARNRLEVGLNLVGYFRADLGIGESVRCAARAAEAAGLPHALVDLRLPCKNPMTDASFVGRLRPDNPYPVNVVHVDAPGMRDLEHHHGAAFFRGKHTVGYWAWELPEFPDSWVGYADFCAEVWTPSDFVTRAVAEKLPVPVLTMPHAIAFAPPEGDTRARFGLPADRFLFLFLYDLNSYSARKNPGAVLEAFRRSGLAGPDAALVIKVHNVAGNEADFARLQAEAAALPGTRIIAETLPRAEVYALEAACDCFVSLHRSEGFGLAVAEAMYLGKPVISTDWSATAEFVTAENGLPVRCRPVTLERSHGPYAKGQVWADPDLDHAAEQMRRVAGDAALARRLGAAAARTIRERFAPAVVGARYRRRLEAIAGW